MFRALHTHRQEVEIVLMQHPLSQWPSGAQVERELPTAVLSQPVHRKATD